MKFIKHVAVLAAAALIVGLSGSSVPVQAGGLNGPGPVSVFNQYPGGLKSALNITAATTSAAAGIKSGSGTVMRIIPIVVGSAGSLTLNDLAVNTGAAAANELFTIPYTAMTVGVPIMIEVPFANGLVISAITTGGQFTISYI